MVAGFFSFPNFQNGPGLYSASVKLNRTPATARWQSHQPVAAAAGAAPGAADAPPPPHQRHFSVSFAVMNNYQAAAAAAAQGFGPPASPHAAAAAAAANSRGGFPPANSPGPIDMYSSSAADSVAGYVQAASPQPSGFPTIAIVPQDYYNNYPWRNSPWMAKADLQTASLTSTTSAEVQNQILRNYTSAVA
ncbi:hypothetical protein ANN_08166 [Periplaneta americana]|uniref:Uncharacterized protein n=1 Tax=Periplaneta americana TaxID=6978 RepID=A0ABQ8T0N1_PERAM|nr:hypothetical protein ANN_08166 [Periplaneta americana]